MRILLKLIIQQKSLSSYLFLRTVGNLNLDRVLSVNTHCFHSRVLYASDENIAFRRYE